jgi:phosphate acetyltransferase
MQEPSGLRAAGAAFADMSSPVCMLENRTFEELRTGDVATLRRSLRAEDITAFAALSGDVNPAHLDEGFARHTVFHGVVAHGMWTASLISTVLGTRLPGPGTVYLGQELHFRAPVRVGDLLTVELTVLEKHVKGHVVVLSCRIVNQAGHVVVDGVAHVMAPTEKMRMPASHLPQIEVHDAQASFIHMLEAVKSWPAVPCAIVWPCDEPSLTAASHAARSGLVSPVLLGPSALLRELASQYGIDLSGCHFDDVHDPLLAAAHAARLVAAEAVGMVMKGSLKTSELLRPLLQRVELRTPRRLSHVWRFDLPHLSGPIFLTDGVINIRPDLRAKRDIVQNAIDCCHLQGLQRPRVAILSAVEDINPAIESTLHAAQLCKMAERGQITGGILEGPLALDLALSERARQLKHVRTTLEGRADILVVPDMESGNLLGKQLEHMAGALSCGIVTGWHVPIALMSRSDSLRSRLAGIALARQCIGNPAAVLA